MAVEIINKKRFCVQYRETPVVPPNAKPVPKPKVFHNFFTATDEGEARKEFWATPTWKPDTNKVEILGVTTV